MQHAIDEQKWVSMGKNCFNLFRVEKRGAIDHHSPSRWRILDRTLAKATLLECPERTAMIWAKRGAPMRDKSPIRSKILWRTISSENRAPSGLRIRSPRITKEFSRHPPLIIPFSIKGN